MFSYTSHRTGGKRGRTRESTNTDHFVKNPAFSTAKITVDERGLIILSFLAVVNVIVKPLRVHRL